MMNNQEIQVQTILDLDKQDPLADKRAAFYLPENLIYLDGNSLGPMPIVAQQRAYEVMNKQWGDDLITSWNKHAWIDLPERVGEKIAPLIGADPRQVVCCDSVSVNLFKLLATALRINPGRTKIVSQNDNFPTDLYVAHGLSDLVGPQSCQLSTVVEDEIESALDESVAVLMLTQVNFRTGKIHDIESLTQKAHDKGILVIWDLAHSTGVIPLSVDRWQLDFAVGCSYKYLNGGPGAPAFVYAAKRHMPSIAQPLTGWMGHQSPFAFDASYAGIMGMKQFLCGTPGILSMSVLDAALEVFNGIDMEQVREKSLMLSDLFHRLLKQHEELNPLVLLTPLERAIRGSQLAYRHPQAYAICQALIAEGVVADFRAPDVLRFGFSPLFLRFQDIYNSVSTLARIVRLGLHDRPELHQRQTVT